MSNDLAGDIDFLVVRENVEGEYSSIGGIQYEGLPQEAATQLSIFTRHGVDRILHYAFELARERPARHLTSATKSNGIYHTMPYWDERARAVAEDYPDLKASEGFMQLHDSLVEIEEHLQYARRYYNGSVRDNNNLVEGFPSLLIARLFGFRSATFFEIELASQRIPPAIRFEPE